MFRKGFDSSTLKIKLKMAVNRIEILKGKKTEKINQNKRQVAVLLAELPPKEENARILAAAVMHEVHLVEALEILQLECELLHDRIRLLEREKKCPTDLVQVVSTLIWASYKVDVPELVDVRKGLKSKYGKQFEDNAMRNIGGCLNENIVTRLSVEPPAAFTVTQYLEQVSEQYNVKWMPEKRFSLTATELKDGSQQSPGPKVDNLPIAPQQAPVPNADYLPKVVPTVVGVIIDDNYNPIPPPCLLSPIKSGFSLQPDYPGKQANVHISYCKPTRPDDVSTITNDTSFSNSPLRNQLKQQPRSSFQPQHDGNKSDLSEISAVTDVGDYSEPDIFVPAVSMAASYRENPKTADGKKPDCDKPPPTPPIALNDTNIEETDCGQPLTPDDLQVRLNRLGTYDLLTRFDGLRR